MKEGSEAEENGARGATDKNTTNGDNMCPSVPNQHRHPLPEKALGQVLVAEAAVDPNKDENSSLPIGGNFGTTLLGGMESAKGDTDKDSCPKGKNDNRDKIFVCGICNRCFGYKHVLQNHERTHTGEKPFECKECHKRFTRDHHLKTHMRLHTGEKPYQCTHCDRQFVQVANLRRHLRVHTGERPYACQMCTSRFSDSNQLKAHMLIHRGEKPFECKDCMGRFRRRHHLIHHKCPKDEANAGKPRRGRRPKAYDQLPGVIPLTGEKPDQLQSSEAEDTAVENNSSSEQEQSSNAHCTPSKSRRKPSHTIRILTPQQRELFLRDKGTMQTQAIDMSLAPTSEGPLTVIVPKTSASTRFIPSSVEGVLDLSSSRSDSEADVVEDEDVDDLDDDYDGESFSDDDLHPQVRARLKKPGTVNGGDDIHDEDSNDIRIHGNGEHASSEEDGSNGGISLAK